MTHLFYSTKNVIYTHVLSFLQLISSWLNVVGRTRGGGWEGTEKLQKHLVECIALWFEMSSMDLEPDFTSTGEDTGALAVPKLPNLGLCSCWIFPRSKRRAAAQEGECKSLPTHIVSCSSTLAIFLLLLELCKDQTPPCWQLFLPTVWDHIFWGGPCIYWGESAQKAVACRLQRTRESEWENSVGACCESARNSLELVLWKRIRVKWIKIQENVPCVFTVPSLYLSSVGDLPQNLVPQYHCSLFLLELGVIKGFIVGGFTPKYRWLREFTSKQYSPLVFFFFFKFIGPILIQIILWVLMIQWKQS